MVVLLRIFFWPLVWLAVELAGLLFDYNFLGVLWRWFISNPLENSLWIIGAYYLWKLFVLDVRFWYATLVSRKLVHMKVLLPRTDSKIDQEKRTEKDFKEKVAVMEQLYRALWEVKSLTFWQYVHFWIFRYATISFEMFMEHGELMFYVLTQPNLASIVEKQITAFYSDAEVVLQKTPDIWPKGAKLVAYYMGTRKKFMFPIRYYEHMQDDPLNDVANVLSKMSPEDTAAIQVVITPTFSDAWSK